MKLRHALISACLLVLLLPKGALADTPTPGNLVLKTDFRIWEVNLKYQDLFSEYEKVYYKGIPVSLSPEDLAALTPELTRETVRGLDVVKIRDYLERKIAPDIYREREDVTIDIDIDGKPIFDGHGLYGRKLDSMKAAFLVKGAIENEVKFVHLPLLREEPVVTVHKKLQKQGITELLSSGETDFSGSPANRINNIQVGLSRFNGHIIEPGEEFVFGKILGPVEEWTGYKKELVIAGDRTVPEYGGGLCQVSTTAYRAALAAGFPVTARRNHSYAVSYYKPIGLDATVYPPQVDLKFINDSKTSILMQSFTIEGRAYYNFYGTKDGRQVHMIGPYYYDQTSAPAPRVEYTTELLPGEKKNLGHAVPGIQSDWYRVVSYADEKKEPYIEFIHSKYQARPDFTAVGVLAENLATPEGRRMIESGF
ncbi:MAG: VanW family protein [Candidatus Peregrinibacteria bacterium]